MDSRVLLLQTMYLAMECEQLPPPPPVAIPRQERPRVPESFPNSSWLVLDEVSLTDMFQVAHIAREVPSGKHWKPDTMETLLSVAGLVVAPFSR